MFKNIIYPACLILIITVSCVNNVNISNCIEPDVNFSFPSIYDGSRASKKNILPSSPWEVASQLEEGSYQILLNKSDNVSENELWLLKTIPTSERFLADQNYELISYNISTNSFETKFKSVAPLFQPPFYSLFTRRVDGTIWSYNFFPELTNKQSEQPSIFSIYDPISKEFIIEEGAKSIPNSSLINSQIYIPNYVLLDSSEVFWIVVPNDSIYSYDPATKEQVKKISISEIFPDDVTISKDGFIYISYSNLENLRYTKRLLIYSIQDNSIIEVNNDLELWTGKYNIFATKSGDVWFGALGYRKSDGVWYQLFRSPIFIANNSEKGSYSWQNPDLILESSNNHLWFRSSNGMVSLDPSKGEWCWFTTYQSSIVEDSDRNLWMIADNKLYKLPLGEQ